MSESDEGFGSRVGRRLRQVREGLGLSQQQMADRLGGVVGQSAISKWESGKIPDAETIANLEWLLGLPPGSLTVDRWEDREPTIADVRDVVLVARLYDDERKLLLSALDVADSSRRRGGVGEPPGLGLGGGLPDVPDDLS